MASRSFHRARTGILVAVLAAMAGAAAAATEPQGFLETLHHQSTLASSVPENGDQNPYAIVVAPVSAGVIHKDDVLLSNFNDDANLQGRGTTIVIWRPGSKQTTVFSKLPRQLAGCPRRDRPWYGDDHAEVRLGDRRQHAEP